MGVWIIKTYHPMTTGTAGPVKFAISKYIILYKNSQYTQCTYHLQIKSIIFQTQNYTQDECLFI